MDLAVTRAWLILVKGSDTNGFRKVCGAKSQRALNLLLWIAQSLPPFLNALIANRIPFVFILASDISSKKKKYQSQIILWAQSIQPPQPPLFCQFFPWSSVGAESRACPHCASEFNRIYPTAQRLNGLPPSVSCPSLQWTSQVFKIHNKKHTIIIEMFTYFFRPLHLLQVTFKANLLDLSIFHINHLSSSGWRWWITQSIILNDSDDNYCCKCFKVNCLNL